MVLIKLIEHTLRTSEWNKDKCIHQLREVLNFCKVKPERVWTDQQDPYSPRTEGPGIRVRRMMRLCVRLKAIEEGLILLNLIATIFPKTQTDNSAQSGHYLNRPQRNPAFYEGIQSDAAAETIAEFVQFASWGRCSTLLDQLVCCSRATYQIAGFANLAIHLLNRDCLKAASVVANKTTSFLFADDGVLFRQLDMTSAVCCVLMAISMEGNDETQDKERVGTLNEYAKLFDVTALCQLIVYIGKKHAPVIKKTQSSLNVYTNFVTNVLKRDVHAVAQTISPNIVDFMNLLLWLEDSSILQKFVSVMCSKSNSEENNLLLETLTNCRPLRTACLATAEGKQAICDLVNARIAELEALEGPEFSWSQSSAVFPAGHPTVEAFLRSPQESMVYASQFNGIQHARNFAEKYFSENSVVYGYSADTEVSGVGKASKCKIIKNRRLYDYMVEQYDLRRTELVKLENFRDRQCEVPVRSEDVVAEQTEEFIFNVPEDDRVSDSEKCVSPSPELPTVIQFYCSDQLPATEDSNTSPEPQNLPEVDDQPMESSTADLLTSEWKDDVEALENTPNFSTIPDLIPCHETSEERRDSMEIEKLPSHLGVAETSVMDQYVDDQRSPIPQVNEILGFEEETSTPLEESSSIAAVLSNESRKSVEPLSVVVEPVIDTVNGVLLAGKVFSVLPSFHNTT